MNLNTWGPGFLSLLPGFGSCQAVRLLSPPCLFEVNNPEGLEGEAQLVMGRE